MLSVDEAMTSRRSVRSYLADPVSRETVAHILNVAKRSPSGTNMQPWKVHVLMGVAKERMTNAVLKEFYGPSRPHEHEREPFYLEKMREPYLGRRRKVGWDMYGLVGIEKGEKEKMKAQAAENFRFFGAPVGLIFTVDEDFGFGSWLDIGMFLENVMLAARGQGLDTCAQAAFGSYYEVVRTVLGLDQTQTVVCGMSLGKEDSSAPISKLITDREDLDVFVNFLDE
ncbi:MAG: nitroreductase [Alphaproteobacteria bacterium]|jgi:nitroreductase|tara:strand:- start:208 stop:885 length:678 start_codon:yes stop_codon:yes gene_type:complete